MNRCTFLTCALLTISSTLMAYEDKSHQALTAQAMEIARSRGAGPDLIKLSDQIIAGAGRHDGLWWCEWLGADTGGEDYTKYRIEGDCKVRVRRMGGRRGVKEPFSQVGSDRLTLKT